MSIQMVFTDRKFRPLFWAQFFGALNDNVLKNAMVILIEYRGLNLAGLDAPSIVALAGGIFILPFFLFSMAAGQIADKFEKSHLVRLVKYWELGITAVSSFGFYFHSVGLLLLALFMMGTHSTFFGPIKYSSIPDLVGQSRLVVANAYVEVGTFLAILLGTIAGGVIILLPQGELWCAFALNLCALLGLWAAYRLPQLPSEAQLKVQWSPIGPLLDTLRLLRERREIYNSILAISAFWFFGAAILSILPPYCKEFLRVDGHVITGFLAMYTVGIGLGSLLCSRLSAGRVEIGLVPIGAVGMVIFLFDLSQVRAQAEAGTPLMSLGEFLQAPHGLRLMFDFLMMSVMGGFFILPLYTLLQERSERQFRSRVIAGNNVLNAIFMVVSAVLVMGLHMAGVSLPQTFLLLAAILFLLCAYLFWTAPEFLRETLGWWRRRKV